MPPPPSTASRSPPAPRPRPRRAPASSGISTVLIDADGEVVGTDHRTHPVGPYIYEGGDLWDFPYEEHDEIPVFDMGWGKVGIVTCSEVFVPEVARVLALKGAELCLFPTGILIDELGYTDNWRTLVRARAIENLMYTAVTVNLFDPAFADPYRTGARGAADRLRAHRRDRDDRLARARPGDERVPRHPLRRPRPGRGSAACARPRRSCSSPPLTGPSPASSTGAGRRSSDP